MNTPILLLKTDLTKPIILALKRIEEIRHRKANNDDSIILEGLFVLAVSSFENSLIDTLRILFTNIPEKLDVKSENITKNELIDGFPLKHTIETKVQTISYKNLQDIIVYFCEKTGLRTDLISANDINILLEIKATRNLLIHNNLVINNHYLQTAGLNQRQPTNNGNKLSIDQDYLYRSLIALNTILTEFLSGLNDKFIEFTRARAIKELFKYIFKTPIMVFDNEFEIDEERDVIGSLKDSSRKNTLSSSERFYYDIWVSHSHGQRFEFDSGQFFSITSKEKFSFFVKNIHLLKS